MGTSPESVLLEVGQRLARASSNKDVIVKLLKQAAGALSELRPSLNLENRMRPFNISLIQHNLLHHRDKDVKLLIGFCFIQVMRVVAPNPPYGDDDLKVVFKLLINSFAELADVSSPYFARRAEMLETFSALRCCVVMLDIGCEDQVLEMFKIFFSVIREDHQQSLYQAMAMIIAHIIEEKITEPLMEIILLKFRKKEKDVNPSFKLAVLVVENCADKLAPFVWDFLTSNRYRANHKVSYHEVILELAQCAPQILDPAIPKMTEELMTDQVDVRIKAVNLLGKLFRLPGCALAKRYHKLFEEFLNRFNDKSVEVRIAAIGCARACYLFSPTCSEASELLSAVDRKLLDYDDKVRGNAVSALCDLVKCRIRHVEPNIISHIHDRLRDKKVSVRKIAVQRLLELYRTYCMQSLEIIDHFEQIPSKVLALCYDKDCQDFRPQSMDFVLAEGLFPAELSVERRSKHWLSFYSFFCSPHVKALNTILYMKKRLQMEMQSYLALRKSEKGHDSGEVCSKILHSFKKMSIAFVDPCKAVENFEKLHQSKDNNIFKTLLQLVSEDTSFTACQTIREKLLKRLGVKHPHYDFLKMLSGKCSFNIVNSEQVKCILLDCLSRKRTGSLQATSMDLLVNMVSAFPALLRGSERQLLDYIREEDTIGADFLALLAKAGHYISINLSDLYPYLELPCLKGTRLQAKNSVAAISAIAGDSLQQTFSNLYLKLVDFLKAGRNVPTVLQSLGCIAQHSWMIFMAREEEVVELICENCLAPSEADAPEANKWSTDDDFVSASSKLIIYGLKALVRMCLAGEGASSKRHVGRVLNILVKFLPEGDTSDCFRLSENDKAYIRLASAKALLKLAGKWNLYIRPKVFHLALMRARDPSSDVRSKYISKVHELLKKRAIPIHYACNFVLAASDCMTALRADSMVYLLEFIKEHGREARDYQMRVLNTSGKTIMTNYPEYILVYLVHFLAHDVGFPAERCQDQEVFVRFFSPLVVFVNAFLRPCRDKDNNDEVGETASYLLSIFRAIKKAEDAIDIQVTQKLHLLADIGMLLLKSLCDEIKFAPNSNKTILLPSSLYKVGQDKKNGEAFYAFFRTHSMESFIKKVINEPELLVVKGTISKSTRKLKSSDCATHVQRAKRSKKELSLNDEVDLILDRCGNVKESIHGVRNLPNNDYQHVLTDELGDVAALATCSQISSDNDKISPEVSDGNDMKKDQDSSCGSVVTLPSISGSQNLLSDAVLETNDLESLKYCKASDTAHNLSGKRKGVDDSSQELADCFNLLSSPDDLGNTCDGSELELSPSKVRYDSGETETITLANTKGQVLGRFCFLEKEVRLARKPCCSGEGFDVASGNKASHVQPLSKKRRLAAEGVVSKGRPKAPKRSLTLK